MDDLFAFFKIFWCGRKRSFRLKNTDLVKEYFDFYCNANTEIRWGSLLFIVVPVQNKDLFHSKKELRKMSIFNRFLSKHTTLSGAQLKNKRGKERKSKLADFLTIKSIVFKVRLRFDRHVYVLENKYLIGTRNFDIDRNHRFLNQYLM